MRAVRDFTQARARLGASRWSLQTRGAATGAPLQVADATAARQGVILRVLRGRHQGAEAEVESGRIALGSSLNGDIVLTDPGIEPEHVEIDLHGKPGARSVTISARAPGVLVGGDELGVGTPRNFALPATIDLADASIQFVDPVPAERKALAPWAALPLAVTAGIGAAALGSWAFSSPPPSLDVRRPALAGAPASGSASPIALGEAAQMMQRQLVAAGLDKQIKVTQRDNVLLADGTLALEAYPQWRAIKAAVRERVAERLLIADTVKPVETGEGPRKLIAAVGGGKSPTVTAVNGKRAGIGEVLSDGWVVRQISTDAVTLERGTSRVVVKLTP